jgi:hypothetical protein
MKRTTFRHSIPLAAIAVLLGVSLNVTAQTVQYVTLHNNTNTPVIDYPVQPDQLISVVGWDWKEPADLWGNSSDGAKLKLLPYNGLTTASSFGSQIPMIITGLTNIHLQYAVFVGIACWATFQITTPGSGNVISNYVPADAIVIPASATGSVQIILESSKDLVNWTAASPGIYGASSATNRFFRVRGVHD